jgi:hypothetical protein
LNLDQTLYSFNTSSFVNTSEYRKYVDDILKVELGSSLYIRVPGFYKAFFEEIADLRTVVITVFIKCQKGDNPLYRDKHSWCDWPDSVKEKDILKWFAELIKVFLKFTVRRSVKTADALSVMLKKNSVSLSGLSLVDTV